MTRSFLVSVLVVAVGLTIPYAAAGADGAALASMVTIDASADVVLPDSVVLVEVSSHE